MKILKLPLILTSVILVMGCVEEVQLYNFEKYKFVSFIDQEVSISETFSVENDSVYPIYLRYDGNVLDEDFTVDVNIIENNAEEGADYTVESKTVLFKAGDIKSEPLEITLIDDLVNSTETRSLEITIESVSNPNIAIGVGIVNQSNKSFVLNILDNECSETVKVFNSANIVSSAGGYTVSGTVDGMIVTLEGTLIDYAAFPNAELAITLTPVVEGASSGTAIFEDYSAGTDNDGYAYQFKQNGEGIYDVCSGEINVVIDVYYESGGDWVLWYTSTNSFALAK